MNNNIELLEIAYLYLKNKNSSKKFENIWNNIVLKNDIFKYDIMKKKEYIIGMLYTDLVLDNRFVLTSDGTWGLREFLKYDDIKKQYDYTDKFESIKEFADINFDNEKKYLVNDFE